VSSRDFLSSLQKSTNGLLMLNASLMLLAVHQPQAVFCCFKRLKSYYHLKYQSHCKALFTSVLAEFDPIHQCAIRCARCVADNFTNHYYNNFDLTSQKFCDALQQFVITSAFCFSLLQWLWCSLNFRSLPIIQERGSYCPVPK